MTLTDLILTTITLLVGKQGEDWQYYGCDGEEWWALRLYSRIN